ncbi:HAMP domain-containing histidine kinase [Natronosporangium hydrolyticum]|uniref:histidine kinase n=1 Tax=Natronosporangium hydrolyticum TaxID=2811111 RepID=A0A895Y8Y9_9ACTN|nr:HAMP domain-containing sensor histidine kinase [Natronosporangium hydrolyticum]QSB14214.1 HAMP domain-containing histidine kinase [Natronosporangium hydrolyticum]
MRLTVARLALAITTMVALAFLVPLAMLTRQVAHDQAVAEARAQAAAVVVALAVDPSPALLEQAVASTAAGSAGRLAVHLPDQPPIGSSRAEPADIAGTVPDRRPALIEYADGLAYLQPSVLAGDQTAVIEVYLPHGEIYRGVWPAWLGLAGLAVVLVIGSTLVADRLGARLVRATRDLAAGARKLGTGDLTVQVVPAGPPELRDAAQAFNTMAGDMRRLIDDERNLAADLSHRLRTPMTALRLDVEALPRGPVADRMTQAFDLLDDELEAIITGARRSAAARPGHPTDLVEVLADRLAFWSVLAEDQGRETSVVGGDRPVRVPVPRDELILAIDALLGNVFAHTPEQTAFRVTVGPNGLVVEDAGPGIADPAAAVRRGASGSGSTGLGLDIAQRVAGAVGGRLEIGRSQLGGARIALLLPPRSGGPGRLEGTGTT